MRNAPSMAICRGSVSFILGGLLCCTAPLACTGKGEPTSPSKIARYTEDNVKRSVRTAPDVARRAGNRAADSVEATGDAIKGEGGSEGE